MSTHYNFAERATRVVGVSCDTNGNLWIVQREYINSAWRTTLKSEFTRAVNTTTFEVRVTTANAGFVTAQLGGWPVNYEDPVMITLGGDPGLGAVNELPAHPDVSNAPYPGRNYTVTAKFIYQAPASAGQPPVTAKVTFEQGRFSLATYDLVPLVTNQTPVAALWIALRLPGRNQGGIVFPNKKFKGELFDASGTKTGDFTDQSTFGY
jgi:hypothetical protein